MLPLLASRASPSLIFKKSLAKKHFGLKPNPKLEPGEILHLLFPLFKHLDASVTINTIKQANKSQKQADKSKLLYLKAQDGLKKAEKVHPNTEQQVAAIAKESLGKSMQTIIQRLPHSKIGVMYEKDYFREILTEENSYAEYESNWQHRPKREYPHFKTSLSICHFIAKTGMPASEALNAFFVGPTAADCGSTIEAVYLKAVLDVLGTDKFDKLFKARTHKLKIEPWVCTLSTSPSSIYAFTELVNAKIFQDTDEKQLQIGDHIFISGTPWYRLKHPRGVMGGMHAIVVDYDAQKNPLIAGLEFDSYQSIKQAQQALVDSSNAPRTEEDIAIYQTHYRDSNILAEHIDYFFKNKPHLRHMTCSDILKPYSLQEVKALGGCALKNQHICRLSSYALAILKEASLESDLQEILHTAKAVTLARHIFQ